MDDAIDDAAMAAARQRAALRTQAAYDITLPRWRGWNYDACLAHQPWINELDQQVWDAPKPGCRQCGVHLRRHQRVGVAWLYLRERGLLADTVGSGKTFQAGGLFAQMAADGDFDADLRAVVVCRPAAMDQWRDELARVLPLLQVELCVGTRRERVERLLRPWQVMLIGYQMLQREVESLLSFQLGAVVVDDVDPLRHAETKTAWAIKRLARDVRRVVVMTGTPLQKKLHELHSVLEPLGGREVFGSARAFERRYVRTEHVIVYNNRGRRIHLNKPVGYKNLSEFQRLVSPLALRRVAADIDDVELPTINAATVELDLYPAQRERYDELRRGVVELVTAQGRKLKHAVAIAKLHYGALICGGLASLGEPDGAGASAKLDWIMQTVGDGGDLEDEKVVIFCHYKVTIAALVARLAQAQIGHAVFTGDVGHEDRTVALRRFWEDPDCRVFIGTTALEQSLNLQVARHLICVDTILNPARMEQLAGRIRRQGSAFHAVYVHTLVCANTHEERIMPHLEREQALIDVVWDEDSELFDKLSPLKIASFITG